MIKGVLMLKADLDSLYAQLWQAQEERDEVVKQAESAARRHEDVHAIARYYKGRAEAAESKLSFFESAGFPTPQDALEKIEAVGALAETRLNYGLWALRTIEGMLQRGDVVTIVPGRWLAPDEALALRQCICGGPSMQPCGPKCRYPYTDQRGGPYYAADDWVDMGKFHPCPVCGDEEISFGPPDSSGGVFYNITAVYCAMCGTVFQVAHWSEQGGTRFAELRRVD